MRITNKMITTKYIRSLGTLSSDLDKLNTQMTSGRKFMKSSENTSAAIKAYKIRGDLAKLEGYQSNIEHAKSYLTDTESAMFHIKELVQAAKDRILVGLNGTASQSEREIVSTEIRNIQDQLLQTLNTSVSDVFLFGGTNTDSKPFEVRDGRLFYNGIDLDNVDYDQEKNLKENSRYIDIGLNVKFNPTAKVDRSTVFSYSIPGIDIVSSGKANIEGTEISNNLYNLLEEIAQEFDSDDYTYDKVNKLYGHLNSAYGNIINSITVIGSKTSYLDFMTERLDTRTLNLQENQLSTEGADPVETIIKFKSQEMAYNAALKMGTRIIQPSIFDYMA
ncbi:MAG: hypothetical protein PHR60_08000 [Eubacteriales bacterium]|nr:hypothetical protein [Eubacteriales bacterium]